MSFKINAYDPKGTGYAPRIRAKEWAQHQSYITAMHRQRVARKVMLERLHDERNFSPSIGQLQAKMKDWNLKVYTKDACEVDANPKPLNESNSADSGARNPSIKFSKLEPAFYAYPNAYDIAWPTVESWVDDYRVHSRAPAGIALPDASEFLEPALNTDLAFHTRALPPEYTGGGLLANSVDSHWPLPQDEPQAESMLQAAHYYHSLHAFQQAFSIYRAVYTYQKHHLAINDPHFLRTVLCCAAAVVTDHQRNIMHSVLREVGASSAMDNLDSLLVECLESASLDMLSSEISFETGESLLAMPRALGYACVSNIQRNSSNVHDREDPQLLLFNFGQELLIIEHEYKLIQRLLGWCETAVETVHHELDGMFVGATVSPHEYCCRIAQVLAGHLVAEWIKESADRIDLSQLLLIVSHRTMLEPISNITQILVASAFMIVEAVRCDPSRDLSFVGTFDSMWFRDATLALKHAIRMLRGLDDRNRCSIFSSAYVERFYVPISQRQSRMAWKSQLPAIVDTVGIILAQQSPNTTYGADIHSRTASVQDADLSPTLPNAVNNLASSITFSEILFEKGLSEPLLASVHSECNSLASFLDTYHRTLEKPSPFDRSGLSSPGDAMSLSSSFDFKFGFIASIGPYSGNDYVTTSVSTSEAG